MDANVKVMGDRLLSMENEELLLKGGWLTDIHINIAQQLLSQQFPELLGLHSTLVLSQARNAIPAGASSLQIMHTRGLQIMHTRGNHWIVASTIKCTNKVMIFDTLYTDVHKHTKELIMEMFGMSLEIRMEKAPNRKELKIVEYLP